MEINYTEFEAPCPLLFFLFCLVFCVKVAVSAVCKGGDTKSSPSLPLNSAFIREFVVTACCRARLIACGNVTSDRRLWEANSRQVGASRTTLPVRCQLAESTR